VDSTAAAVCAGFAAECRAGRQETSIGSSGHRPRAQQQRRRSMALSSKCTQCHVDRRVKEAGNRLLGKENTHCLFHAIE